MPVAFDPAWEYWVGDPEVAELLAEESAAGGFDAVTESYYRRKRDGFNSGTRFGTGDPDAALPRLAPKRSRFDREHSLPPTAYATCPGCGTRFEVAARNGKKRKHCSRECYTPKGAAYRRERAASAACAGCGRAFEPKRVGQRFCGRRCGGAAAKRNQWGPHA